ncbi:uncharacterized protein M6B38_307085 [Iris pallida]|uniref:Uncharacterized protein n=1 Tax=Iris pallida TaxID=29817 RepID=A0AAX6HJZ6_IRIPA|nr:uncharacterized protein M6B38_307085 [Iris pallida]
MASRVVSGNVSRRFGSSPGGSPPAERCWPRRRRRPRTSTSRKLSKRS